MTTTVTVQAHVAEGLEAEVTLFDEGKDPETIFLKDGETFERSVYGEQQINIQEVKA